MAGQRISRGKRMLAAAGALALASAGMVSLGGAAVAADGDPVSTLGIGNINPETDGSITVHKHKNQTAETAPGAIDGSTMISDPGLAGVTFTVQQLDVDLSSASGWTTLQSVTTTTTPCSASVGFATGSAPVQMVTNGAGIATFPGLEVGAYLVCETAAPNEVVDRAAPFVVAIPFPNTTNWLYDVHVYPKNLVAGTPEKDVSAPSDLAIGSTVEFPVSIAIPNAGPAGFSSFMVSDDLDTRLTRVGNGVLSSVISGAPDVEMDLGVHYEVNTVGNNITVNILPAGLAVMNSMPGQTLTVTFEATVNGLGDIDNTAVVNVNGKDFNTNEVTTSWGDVVISKSDGANQMALSGATFEIWAAADPYAATCVATPTGAPLSIGGQTTFTTGMDGKVTIPGVFVSDSNTDPASLKRCYVLRETAAPAGYVMPADPLTAVSVTAGATADVDIAILNRKQEGPALPLTGAAGQLLMVAGGSAVLVVGAGLMVASRRRHKVQN